MANTFAIEIAKVQAQIVQTQANIARDRALLAADPNGPNAERLQIQIDSGTAYLADLFAQLAIFQEADAAPSISAGAVVTEASAAREDGATTSSPPSQPTQVVTAEGRIDPAAVETGTNDPVRTTQQTQATPPPPFVTGDEEGNPLPPTPSLNAGVGAPSDDGVSPNRNATAQMLNASFNQQIVPEPNVLDAYASYTYAVSWYLLTPEQYSQMTTSQKKNISSWQLLMQSGGAPTQQSGGVVAGRNKFFSLDYYIDDLEIDSIVPLKGTGAANTATDIRFRVTEPSGITLMQNLFQAVRTLYQANKVSKNPNYVMAQYCLAVRFYGYNESGELVTTGRRGSNGSTNLTDPKAIIEKFYPFVLTNIKFKVGNKLTEYEVSAKPIPHYYNKSQDRGTIPFAFELSGETVQQVLVGKPAGTQTPGSPGERNTTPQPTPGAPTIPDSYATSPTGEGLV
jgi:hypothetical protein